MSHYIDLNEISKPAKKEKLGKIPFVLNKTIKRQVVKAVGNSSQWRAKPNGCGHMTEGKWSSAILRSGVSLLLNGSSYIKHPIKDRC